MTTSVWHCERAWLGGDEVARDVVVGERDGAIATLETGQPPPPDARLLRGIVLPGMANTHSHAFHRALRGRGERGVGTFWTWRELMYELASRLDPETYLELATATFGEMLCAGFTTVGEFHYLHHDADGAAYRARNEMTSALVEAAVRSGIRMTLLDTCYLESAPGTPPNGVQRRFADRSAAAWAERVDGLGALPASVRLGAAIHSVRAVPPDAMRVVAAWADDRHAPLHAHVSEQLAENEIIADVYSATPTRLLHDAGALTDRFCAVHATHLVDDDRALFGAAHAGACVCPTTERSLADGLVELTDLAEAGVAISIGTDAHVSIDPFAELRGLEGHERLRVRRRGAMSPVDQLEAATVRGHQMLGWPGAGVLAVGAPCDLVAVATDTVRLAGTGEDTLAAIVVAADATDVTAVVVGGRLVVEHRRHVDIDVPARLDEAVRRAWR